MTVAELIKKLQGFNDDLPVYVQCKNRDGYDHWDFIGYVNEITVDEDGEIGLRI